ncbi:allophanate hydrolase [Mycolicibacterium vaccae]|uniref:allophanate hydrolase n=1 Tax=Mycolicibacterium vaccae TaxID=1810 RepID=UPI003CED0B42
MTAVERVRAAYALIAEVDRPEIWIALRPMADVLADARTVDEAVAAGAELPLAGLLAAVKNNIDVAGLPTTAACPTYPAGAAESDATVVARLRAAGAVVVGATNLDQFATGLVGTRSPYGAVRDARRPDRISGGSSSGSAVAVALGLVDVALGTDTAGSGRVPAALQGIVGIKPTVGVVPTDGVVPACRSFDCVTVFARDLDTADAAMGVIAGGARPFPPDAPLAAPDTPRIAVPRDLPALDPAWANEFQAACARLRATGAELVEIDLAAFLAAARLLYDGGLVAERHEAVGEFIDARLGRDDSLDPTVAAIISAAGRVAASDLLRDRARLAELTRTAMAELGDCDALLVPTTTEHPRIAEVAADPVGVNSRLGTYTNFCNLMDLCAVAVPCGTASDGAQFGVSVVARAGADALALDVARRLTDAIGAHPAAEPWPVRAGFTATPLLVVGAHLRGQPLAWQLESRGARWCGAVETAPLYRMVHLDTAPPKPGLARVGPETGTTIRGELWLVSTAMLGDFLTALPAPMSLGAVALADGSEVIGFGCALDAFAAGTEISHHGHWPGYLARTTPGEPVGPSDVTGRCWRRRALAAPGRRVDTTTDVEWVQGDELYVDLRTPAGLPVIRAASLSALTRDDLLALCAQEAFAGTLLVEDDDYTWVRTVDLHPEQPLPDRGRLHRAGDVVVETGVGRDYHEDWVEQPLGSPADHWELTLRDHDGRTGMLLRVGDRFAYARNRSPAVALESGADLAHLVAHADLEDARALLDLEISLGTVENGVWRINRSTLPFRVGDDLAPTRDGAEVSVGDRTPAGDAARHHWVVLRDHSDRLLTR